MKKNQKISTFLQLAQGWKILNFFIDSKTSADNSIIIAGNSCLILHLKKTVKKSIPLLKTVNTSYGCKYNNDVK
jgi:hypothetical protein